MRVTQRSKRHLNFCWLAAAGLVAGLTFGLGRASAQDRTFELKLSHWVPPSHPLQKALEDWGNSVEKDSGGTIKYKIYPAQQLGKAFDHYDMTRDGIADFAYVNPSYQPGRFPIFDASNLPFMINNAKAGSGAIDDWYRQYAPTEMKDVKYCFAFAHDPGTFHSRTKKIVVPSDIAGMKIRPATAVIASLVTSLGGTNVQAAAPEVRDVIEKGVADAVTFPWGSIVLFGIDKVTKYHIDFPLYTTGFVWIMNKDTYAAMSPAQQKVIDNHCNREWAIKTASAWADFEHDGIAKIKAEPDHEVYSLTDAQLDQWKAAAAPVVQSWAASVKKAGGDPDAALKKLKDDLVKANSSY
ncbi:MAG TPA: TRAP transporter substrate-binding protein [Xanthobacteraceae bacterium]|nr:TRAP transporter substrate-binding protein [Xanthobacteraceae bacterium]